MEEEKREDTALGVARQRFIDGLPRRAAELRSAVGVLGASPENERARDELRRRLHAIYASAQVFRVEPLASALKEAIQRIDGAKEGGPALARPDIDTFETLATSIPRLAGSDVDVPLSSSRSAAPPPRVPTRGRETLRQAPAREQGRASIALGRARKPTGTYTAQTRPFAGEPHRAANVASILLLDDVETQTLVRSALPTEQFELTATDDPEQALRLARSMAPDLVLADRSILIRPGVDFVGRLRGDPLTDFVPIVMLLPPGAPHDPIAVRDAGADDAISKPIDDHQLRRLVDRLTGGTSEGVSFDALGDLTADEIADRVAREVRRGIVESIALGQSLKVPIGDGTEVLGAAWAAIARLRAHIADRSGGRVVFRDAPGRGPALLAIAGPPNDGTDRDSEVSLAGRRILIADDDPAVVWFFAGLLREAGATAVEASNGRIALEEARRTQPELVISDILMQELDGYGLCREIRRDPTLSEVPVIVLSWKEDFLQRMRDLKAGASDYLRKEAGSAQILAQVRAALRPRARLEAQLRAGGEVRGRTEGIGMAPLLRLVAKLRPASRVTVRDAWNLFEIEMREGTLVDVTRTATDGTFARGQQALPSLLGVGSGRFTVADTDVVARKGLEGTIDELIDHAASALRGQLLAVSGRMLPLVERVTFRPDVINAYLRASPEPVRDLVHRLHHADSPRRLLLRGAVDPRVLENSLVDLVRRGAIDKVLGHNGEDLVGRAPPPPEPQPPPPPLQATRGRSPSSAEIPIEEMGRPSSPEIDMGDVISVAEIGRTSSPEVDPRDVIAIAEVSPPSGVDDPDGIQMVRMSDRRVPDEDPLQVVRMDDLAPASKPQLEVVPEEEDAIDPADRTLPDGIALPVAEPIAARAETPSEPAPRPAANTPSNRPPASPDDVEMVSASASRTERQPEPGPTETLGRPNENAVRYVQGKVVLGRVQPRRATPHDRRLDEFELLAEQEEADERNSLPPEAPTTKAEPSTPEALLDRLDARSEKKPVLTVSGELEVPRAAEKPKSTPPPKPGALQADGPPKHDLREPSQPIPLTDGKVRKKREDDTPIVVERKKKKTTTSSTTAARSKPPPPPPASEGAGPGTAAWALLALLFGLVGFVGYRLVFSKDDARTEPDAHDRGSVAPERDEPEEHGALPPEAPDELPPAEQPGEPQEAAPQEGEPRAEGGERRDSMIDVGREVAPNEGGLLVESASAVEWTVRTDQQDLGTTPVRAALQEGRHRLVLTHGDRTVMRYVLIEPGTTFVVSVD